MTLTTSYHDGEQTVKLSIPLLPQTRFNTVETANINDCKYCLYYLGKLTRNHQTYHICNMDICPSELVGYRGPDAPPLTDLQEVIA